MTSLASKQPFQCAFCREELTKDPTDYQVCRLAREFLQQVHQLKVALNRRNTIRRATNHNLVLENSTNHNLVMENSNNLAENNNSRR